MIRRITFFCAVVPIVLALQWAYVFAAPIQAKIGRARIAVVASPEPLQIGVTSFTVTIAGLSKQRLSHLQVRYSTLMPSMQMPGRSGSAVRVPGRPDAWRFTVNFNAATLWRLRVNLSGALVGSVDANLSVAPATNATKKRLKPTLASRSGGGAMGGTASGGAMAGMGQNAGGDASAWRDASFALIATILIGVLVLARERRPATIGMVLVASVVVLGIAFAQSKYAASTGAMASMGNARGSAPVPVTLATIVHARNGTTIDAPAELEPYFVQDIVARTAGVLTDFHAYTGSSVSAGQIVARLSEPELQIDAQAAAAARRAALNERLSAQEDASALRADLSAQRENLRYWNAEIARERTLLRAGAVSVQEYQSERARTFAARSSYAATRAKLAGANASIGAAQARVMQATANARARGVLAGYTDVVAPNDAVVMKRLVDPGVFVEPGTAILQVAVVSKLRVRAQIAQQNLAGLRTGTPMDVVLGGGTVLHGRVSSLSPVVARGTHTALAETIVANPGDRYQPGSFVHVIFHPSFPARGNAYAVPSAALVGGATTALWIDAHGRARRVAVSVLSDDGTEARVSGHLRAGMRVVVNGASELEEGQPIASVMP